MLIRRVSAFGKPKLEPLETPFGDAPDWVLSGRPLKYDEEELSLPLTERSDWRLAADDGFLGSVNRLLVGRGGGSGLLGMRGGAKGNWAVRGVFVNLGDPSILVCVWVRIGMGIASEDSFTRLRTGEVRGLCLALMAVRNLGFADHWAGFD